MSLEDARKATWYAVAEGEDDIAVVRKATEWFRLFKLWESAETFDRAFRDGRMAARVAPFQPMPGDERIDKKTNMMKFQVSDGSGKTTDMNFNPFAKSLLLSLNPQNFITKKKNELGIHEYSSVLLKPTELISKQLFAKVGTVAVFMPIPLEEDLQLFDMLGTVAKRNRGSVLYPWYVDTRARMTRITFGSATDMKVGFLTVDKGDGKPHFRYGHGTITGAAVSETTKLERRYDALHYRKEIIAKQSQSSNNEVTIKYRDHAGGFPLIGNPGPLEAPKPYPSLKAGEFAVANFRQTITGLLKDDGTFTRF